MASDYIQTTEVILKALLIISGQPATEEYSPGRREARGKRRILALASFNE